MFKRFDYVFWLLRTQPHHEIQGIDVIDRDMYANESGEICLLMFKRLPLLC